MERNAVDGRKDSQGDMARARRVHGGLPSNGDRNQQRLFCWMNNNLVFVRRYEYERTYLGRKQTRHRNTGR